MPQKLLLGIGILVAIAAVAGTVGIAVGKNRLKNTQTALPTPMPSETAAPTVSATGPVVVTGVSGTTTVTSGSEKTSLTEGQKKELTNNDTVSTSKESTAIVSFGQGTLTRLAPESSITYREENTNISITQAAGDTYTRFKKILGVREGFEVETTNAVAAVRGTKFAVFQRKTLKIMVDDETVYVTRKDKTGKRLDETHTWVRQGEMTEVDDNLAKKLTVAAQKLEDWEKEWMEFNRNVDSEDPEGLDPANMDRLKRLRQKLLSYLAATPTPSPTIGPSPKPTNTPAPPVTAMFGTGFNAGNVQTGVGTFNLSCIGENKNNMRVVTDSGNESDCRNDCVVKPLHEYAQANGGFAAMNGMYFCPADYPACADKKNSFDTLFFNSRVKRYLNSDNNVYSTIPFLAVEGNGNPLFFSKTLEWGRDTGIMAGTAGNPMLIKGGQPAWQNYSLDDKQRNVKSNRGAIVQKGDNLYMCVVKGATVPDSGEVYKTLGVDNAMNIDGGGSTAMWLNGRYIFGPGRNIPTAVIFARR